MSRGYFADKITRLCPEATFSPRDVEVMIKGVTAEQRAIDKAAGLATELAEDDGEGGSETHDQSSELPLRSRAGRVRLANEGKGAKRGKQPSARVVP